MPYVWIRAPLGLRIRIGGYQKVTTNGWDVLRFIMNRAGGTEDQMKGERQVGRSPLHSLVSCTLAS
jgi:hypothetical protein